MIRDLLDRKIICIVLVDIGQGILNQFGKCIVCGRGFSLSGYIYQQQDQGKSGFYKNIPANCLFLQMGDCAVYIRFIQGNLPLPQMEKIMGGGGKKEKQDSRSVCSVQSAEARSMLM